MDIQMDNMKTIYNILPQKSGHVSMIFNNFDKMHFMMHHCMYDDFTYHNELSSQFTVNLSTF